MKIFKYIYLLGFVFILLACTFFRMNNDEQFQPNQTMDKEKYFVWMNRDTLDSLVIKTYAHLNVRTAHSAFWDFHRSYKIWYPKSQHILLDRVGNGSKTDLDSLKIMDTDIFKYNENPKTGDIEVVMKDSGDYVYCPVALLVRLFEDIKDSNEPEGKGPEGKGPEGKGPEGKGPEGKKVKNGIFYGTVNGGNPNGDGKLVYDKTAITKLGSVEKGYYIVGSFKDGKVISGTLYDNKGNVMKTVE